MSKYIEPKTQPQKNAWKNQVKTFKQHFSENERATHETVQAEKRRISGAELSAKIKILGQTFWCNSCFKPAENPKVVGVEPNSEFSNSSNSHLVYDWSKPGDLYNCKECGELNCQDCLEDGICKRCWSKKLGLEL